MIVALYILLALVAVGLILWLHERRFRKRSLKTLGTLKALPEPPADQGGEQCCGMHITCEKDSLLAAVSDRIEYFDDEELDRFAGRPSDAYSSEETDEFREVLLTLRPDEIAGWARSIQLRGITLPADVRDELLMIVAEARAAKNKNQQS
mgnify:CR=1 FL=1